MSSLTDLPCEVIAAVLRELGNVRSILPLIIACQHIYFSFTEYPGIAADIIERQITPDLVPYAVAASEASQLKPGSRTAGLELLKTLYEKPSILANRVRSMSVPDLTRMGYTHDVIRSFVAEFASSAWTRLARDPGSRAATSAGQLKD
ncbi:hypothetical protein F4811DRAFT_521266 [Daldinia bambusicola]|nr:hypothetical protein F4811DRAFT_521266 [Daldinia bambusicola]